MVKEVAQDRVLLTSPAGSASLRLSRVAAPEAAKPQSDRLAGRFGFGDQVVKGEALTSG